MINKASSIIVTGAAGFIGSCMTGYLNEQGYENLILVDEFDEDEKELNLHGKKYSVRVERENLFQWLGIEKPDVQFIFHLGARTDTTEFDYAIHQHLNVEYSQKIWRYAALHTIPVVYASSAATYGNGELGYADDHARIGKLQPLNPYGISKNEFDKWALAQKDHPLFWAGLKFFNVYGPNEYHKARMASMIFHGYHQVKQNGFVQLFKSHKKGFEDGQQLRDFIYVKDVIKIAYWFMVRWQSPTGKGQGIPSSGIYNVGTGKARSFNHLVAATFAAMDLAPDIKYIDMPEDIRDKYQYFTEAEMDKLRIAGYTAQMYTVEEGVTDYVTNYLAGNNFY